MQFDSLRVVISLHLEIQLKVMALVQAEELDLVRCSKFEFVINVYLNGYLLVYLSLLLILLSVLFILTIFSLFILILSSPALTFSPSLSSLFISPFLLVPFFLPLTLILSLGQCIQVVSPQSWAQDVHCHNLHTNLPH